MTSSGVASSTSVCMTYRGCLKAPACEAFDGAFEERGGMRFGPRRSSLECRKGAELEVACEPENGVMRDTV